MPFETIELVTLLFSAISFVFVFGAYMQSRWPISSKKVWTYFLMISIAILANRVFTNIEALFFEDVFNIFEHTTILIISLMFLYIFRDAQREAKYKEQ